MDRPTAPKARPASARAPLTLMYGESPFAELSLRDPSLPTPTLDRTAQDRIGRELRAMYADLASQPLPQRLLDLLSKLGEPKD
jgi:Anti-sigma factor NepR